MEGKTLAAGGIALVVGLMGGYALSPSGPDASEIEAALGARIDAIGDTGEEAASAVNDAVQSLDARFDEIASQLQTFDERIGEAAGAGAEAANSRIEALEARLSQTGEELHAAIGEMAADQKSALETALASFTAERSPPPAAPEATQTAAAAPAEPAGEPQGLSPGETAILADGAVRVFVSRVDDADAAARLSINGTSAQVTAGHSVALRPDGDYCRVTLDSVDRGHAMISAACGDDLPAPEGVRPGSAALLGDGAARVFLSSVASDDSSASIAVNGVDLQRVGTGETVRIGDTGCRLRIEQIDRGHVTFGYAC